MVRARQSRASRTMRPETIVALQNSYAIALPASRGGAFNCDIPRAASPAGLFELEGLVLALVVDGRAPDLVRGLVFGAAVIAGSTETQIETARVLERVDQLFGVELRAACL